MTTFLRGGEGLSTPGPILGGLAFGATLALFSLLQKTDNPVVPERNTFRVMREHPATRRTTYSLDEKLSPPTIAMVASEKQAKQEGNTAQLDSPPTATSTNTGKDECSEWGCTCQGFSDKFHTIHMKTFGDANAGQRAWWLKQKCNTIPTDMYTTQAPFSRPVIAIEPATATEEDWVKAIENCTHWGLNYGLAGPNKGKAATRDTPGMLPPNVDSSIDVVSLVHVDDFHILLEEEGMLSWLRHIQNIRMVILLGRSEDLPILEKHLHSEPERYQIGSHILSTSGQTSAIVPPIHFFSEDYFARRYKDRLGCPYWKACQQLFKLSVFDMPYLSNNVLIVDSDTAWGKDSTFVYPNGSVLYYGTAESTSQISTTNNLDGRSEAIQRKLRKCTGMDPKPLFDVLTRGPDKTSQSACKIEWCQRDDEPVTAEMNGLRYSLHCLSLRLST